MKKNLTAQQWGAKHSKTARRVCVLCQQGRISGAQKIGRDWVIPADAPDPSLPAGRPLKTSEDEK